MEVHIGEIVLVAELQSWNLHGCLQSNGKESPLGKENSWVLGTHSVLCGCPATTHIPSLKSDSMQLVVVHLSPRDTYIQYACCSNFIQVPEDRVEHLSQAFGG